MRHQKIADFSGIKTFFAGHLEIAGIIEKHQPVNAPHIVLEIGVVKRHAALGRSGRESAHHHHAGVRRQHRGERVGFNREIIHGISGRLKLYFSDGLSKIK